MNKAASRARRISQWVLCAFGALMIYVLSWRPEIGCSVNGWLPEEVLGWLDVFYRPVWIIHNKTLLKKPMDAYKAWWIAALARH